MFVVEIFEDFQQKLNTIISLTECLDEKQKLNYSVPRTLIPKLDLSSNYRKHFSWDFWHMWRRKEASTSIWNKSMKSHLLTFLCRRLRESSTFALVHRIWKKKEFYPYLTLKILIHLDIIDQPSLSSVP